MSAPPNEFELRLARDFRELPGAFAVVHIEKKWPSHIDTRVPHVVWVNGQPVGLVHVEVAVSLARFRESHRLLSAVLDVMARVRTASLGGEATLDEFKLSLLELFAAGGCVSKHLTETETALTIASVEAKHEQPHHVMPAKSETH